MAWVIKIKLPPMEKFLLRVIEGYARDGGSWPLKACTIAEDMGCSVRTVFRTRDALVAMGHLRFVASRYKDAASEYQIIWESIGRALLSNPKTRFVVSADEALQIDGTHDTVSCVDATTEAVTPDTVSCVEETEELITDDTVSGVEASVTHDILSGTHDILSPTHDILSETDDTVSCVDTLYTRGRARTRSFNHVSNQRNKPCREVSDETTATGESPTGGWSRQISVTDLQNREAVQRLWLHALKFKFVTREVRVKFFALAKYTARMANAGEVKNPGGYFTSQVIEKNWLGDHQDLKAAVLAITALDGGGR